MAKEPVTLNCSCPYCGAPETVPVFQARDFVRATECEKCGRIFVTEVAVSFKMRTLETVYSKDNG